MAKRRKPAARRPLRGRKPSWPTVSEALQKLSSPKSYLRIEGASFLERHAEKRHVPAILQQLRREHYQPVQFFLILALARLKDKRALPTLKRQAFGFTPDIRSAAAEALAETIGWKNTIEFISNRFANLGNVPSVFFADAVSWGKSDWAALKEHALLQARKQGLKRMLGKNGRPFSIKGIPVFLGRLEKDTLGIYKDGLLTVEKNPNKLPPFAREATAWHEFGEIFSHETGLAFEYQELKKTGKFGKYLKKIPEKEREFKKIEENW